MKRLACWLRSSLDQVLGQNARLRPGLKANPAKRRSRRLLLEPLEDRTLMSVTPTISWDGGAGPDDLTWPTAVNWTEDRLPNSFDDVGVAVPGEQITVRLDTLGGPVTTVNSLYSEENLEVLGGLALTAGGELTGSLTLSGGPLELPSGADLTLRGGAIVEGSLNVAAGGILRLQSGTYLLGGGGTIAGTIEIAADATVRFFSGSFLLQGGAALTGEGVARIVGAEFDIAGPVTARRVELDYSSVGGSSHLTGAGQLTVSESFRWAGGSMNGTGSTDLAAGATFTITGDSTKFFGSRTLNNAGTTVLTGSGGFASDEFGVFNNQAGATFLWDMEANIGVGNVLYPSLTFNNAGILSTTGGTGVASFYGFFHNSGTLELQNGTLALAGESASDGSFAVASGATLSFGQGTHTLAEASSLTGEGTAYFGLNADVQVNGGYGVQVTRIEGGSANFNAEATTTIVALSAGALSGTGTLTVTGTLDWTGGWMEGTGATIIPSTGVLNLAGDGDRGLNGRRIFNSGQVTWNGLGAITRYTNGAWEVYDNTGVPRQPPAPGAFDPSAAADQIYRAMYGGLTGWGTTEELVYQILEGKTTAQIDAIKDSYSSHYSRSLLWDLQNELSGSEWTRAERLISGNRAAADAAALNYAMFGNISLGTDEETIFAILDGRTTTEVSAIAQAYEGLYGHTLESALLGELSGSQEQRALALLQGNQAEANAAALYYAMQGGVIGIGTDEEAIVKILGSRSPAQLDLIKQAYQQLYGQSLEDALREDLTAAEMDQATGLLAGDPISADAARLRQAMEGAGTDENAVWAVLDGKTSEKRAAIADAYRRMYSEELRDAIHDDFTDDPVIGNELSRTLALLDHGGLSPAERIWYAVKGLGTEEELLDPALRELSRMTPEQIAQVDAAYQALSGGESLRDALDADLAGRAWFDAEQALQGQATTLEERLQRLSAKRASERDGVLNGISSFLLDGFSSDGPRLDDAVARAQAAYNAAMSDDVLSAEETQQVDELIRFAEGDVTTYRETKDAAAETFGTVLSTAAGIAVVWATAGAGAPLALVALKVAGAGAAGAWGQVLGNVVISGQSYDVELLPGHIIEGFVNGGTVAVTFGGLPNSSTAFGRVLQGVYQGALEGVAGGFVGGITGALVQDGTWDEGIWQGLLQAGEAGLLSALTGGITGGLLGAVFSQFWHLCFTAGTPVATEKGLKPIEQIEAGEQVWAYNFHTSGWELRPVVEPLSYDYAGDMVRIELTEEALEATGHHPFWVIEGEALRQRPTPQHVAADEPDNRTTQGRWVDARDLRAGDVFLLRSGRTARVRGLVSRVERRRVDNRHVAELHTYAVGEGGVLVHNRGMPTEGSGGTWIDPTTGVTTRNGNNGVWRSTRPEVLAAESPPGGPALTEVVVVYTNGNPDFSPYVRSIDGVNRGEVQIILSEAPAKTTRLRWDMEAADASYANLLNSQGSRRPDGQLWTAHDITKYREMNKLTWHHMEDVNPDTGQCTMQLVSRALNDKCYHDGGRVIRDRQLGLR